MSAPVLAAVFTTENLVLGLLGGLTYAVLAAGIVLVYRATRVINFAHGELGALGAAVLAKLVLDYDWNYFLALVTVALGGGVVGGVVELTVVRRLFHSPRLVLLVATIGVSQVLFFAQVLLPEVFNFEPYPVAFDRSLQIGDLIVSGKHFMVIAFVPAMIAGLALLLNRTPFGLAIRASAGNAEAARLAGVNVKWVSTGVWVLAGVLATVTAIVINPVRGTVVGLPTPVLGPGLLLRALAAALVGRLVSLPWTLAGGLFVGVVEVFLFAAFPAKPGIADLALFGLVLVLVLVRGRDLGGSDQGWFAFVTRARQARDALAAPAWTRLQRAVLAGVLAAVAVGLPLVFSRAAQVNRFSEMLLFAIVALSVTVLTGWAGQLSLGQFAFVGLGAMVTVALTARGMPFAAAAAYATVTGVLAAIVVGLPALRVRGLSLAVITLAFAVAASSYLFNERVFTGGSSIVSLSPGRWWFVDLSSQRTLYYVCLATLAVAVVAVRRLGASGVGRSLIAVRENEAAAAAMTVSPTRAKLTAFAVSGGLAALAGALLAATRVQFSTQVFGPEESLRVVAMAIIGGLGSVAGAVLGAVFVVGVPALFGDSLEVRLLTSGAGLLVLLLYLPGGLAAVADWLRLAVLERVGVRRPPPSAEDRPTRVPVRLQPAEPAEPDEPHEAGAERVPALRAADVTVRFGGRVALDGVTVEARAGEIVGLIGSNGAGKSTLLNVVSGFVEPVHARIELYGEDVSALSPHERAALGLGRVFQDARLFGALTVHEAITVALEGRESSEAVPAMLGLPPARRAERSKRAEADEIVLFLGLGRYAAARIGELSTGTRRIAELGCLVALQARVLLMDEPTAGVAQRETEAFGPLIARIRSELAATLVIVEHDIPLVMSLSDRVYCLGAGQVISVGEPEDVRLDPKVIASYLGTDERAIRRSGALASLERPS